MSVPFGLDIPELIFVAVPLLLFLCALIRIHEVLVDIREELFNIQSDLSELKPDEPDSEYPPT